MHSGEGMAQNLVKDAFSGSGAKELLVVLTVLTQNFHKTWSIGYIISIFPPPKLAHHQVSGFPSKWPEILLTELCNRFSSYCLVIESPVIWLFDLFFELEPCNENSSSQLGCVSTIFWAWSGYFSSYKRKNYHFWHNTLAQKLSK